MFVTKKAISRRTVLRGMGATVALPLLDAMVPAFATAAATRAVVRFGCVYHPNGVIYDKWQPTGEGRNYELSPTLKGLEPFKDQIIVVIAFARQAFQEFDHPAGQRHPVLLAGFHSRAGYRPYVVVEIKFGPARQENFRSPRRGQDDKLQRPRPDALVLR